MDSSQESIGLGPIERLGGKGGNVDQDHYRPSIPALPLIADANQGLRLLSQFTSA